MARASRFNCLPTQRPAKPGAVIGNNQPNTTTHTKKHKTRTLSSLVACWHVILTGEITACVCSSAGSVRVVACVRARVRVVRAQ